MASFLIKIFKEIRQRAVKCNVISFNGNQIITTSGGCMLLSDNEKTIKKVCFWATQVRDTVP